MILPQDFYIQNTEKVAKQVIGKILCFEKADKSILRGRIVEAEAYLGIEDPACHTFRGRKTERTKSMYLTGGHAYVYLIYGMYHCLNFVTREEGIPEAVLIRALEPVHVLEQKPRKNLLLTNGPGKLCRHFGISRKEDGKILWTKASGLWVEEDDLVIAPRQVASAPRVGIDYAGAAARWPLRFYLKNSPWISRP